MDNNRLQNEKIGRLLLSLAIPSIIAQLVNVLYNIVDRIYIGQLVSQQALAALSVCLPILTFITAFTQLVGVGGAPICAIRMGEGKSDEAEKIMTNSFSLLVICGILLTLIIYVFMKPLLLLFGANSETIVLGIEYLSIYALGTLFVQLTLGMNAYINTQGLAREGMVTVLIGALLNIILDPLFIVYFNMGVKGAALATVIAQGISCVWVLFLLQGKKSVLKLRKKYLMPDIKITLTIMSLGISPFVMSSTESLLQIAFNNSLLAYGGTIGVASMSILVSIWQFIMLPLQGLCQGAQPILSYNYGAKDYQRVKETYWLNLKICLTFAIMSELLIILFAPSIVSIFSKDASTISFTSWALRIYLFGAGVFGAQIACQQSFMALNQAKISLTMAILRKIILLIPLIYLLPLLLGESTFASIMSQTIVPYAMNASKTFCVLLAEPVSDIIAATVTTTMFMRFMKKEFNEK